MSRCPACDCEGLDPVLDVDRVPVHCNILYETRAAAARAPVGDIALAFCGECGLLTNTAFEPQLTAYAGDYENSLHFSPRFQAFARELAQGLVERHGLRGREVAEIGSGRGDFLALLCDAGAARGLGFDPSAGAAAPVSDDRIEIVPDFFSARHGERLPDFVCARHVLEHLDRPRELLGALAAALGERAEAALYLEVPDAGYMLAQEAVWDLIYEHPSYFTRPALVRVLEETGFDVIDASARFGGQYLGAESRPAIGERGAGTELEDELVELRRLAAGFGRAWSSQLARWDDLLAELFRDGSTVALWGAGSKGVTFLNAVPSAREVDIAVDVNPRKHGRYVPGTGQRVVAPEALGEDPPDAVVLLNAIYRDEVGEMMGKIGVSAEVLAP